MHKEGTTNEDIIHKGKLETRQGMAGWRGEAIPVERSHRQPSTAAATSSAAASGSQAPNTGATGAHTMATSGVQTGDGDHEAIKAEAPDAGATGTRHHRDDAVTDVSAVPGQHDHAVGQPSSFNQSTAPDYVENKQFVGTSREAQGGQDQTSTDSARQPTQSGLETTGETAPVPGRNTELSGNAANSGVTGGVRFGESQGITQRDQTYLDSADRQATQTVPVGEEASSGVTAKGHDTTSTGTGSGNTGQFGDRGTCGPSAAKDQASSLDLP
ncbi:hypothetical protein C0991_006434 [Blastosporella zonata]|nr:hypothetical protein C0991_006434 [Blastosporella zonata]